ncbi:MAG TPA: ROK family protein [Acidimicrobiia bacterium]|nr:ROK family protein [Acidimicrobiia bacterium]
MKVRVGVDLGGTKIEAVALDGTGNELDRRRVATPQGDYEGIIGALVALVEEISAGRDTAATVGIGTPGAVSPFDGLMKNSNSVVLNGRPLDRDLQKALGRPMNMRNDADCFALSEAVDGAARGAATVFGVILGTGVGGGVVVDGKVRTGPNRIGGEWGHNPLPWPTDDERPGPDCYCGRRGCIEKWLAGPSLAADHLRVTCDELTAPGVVEAARSGDGSAAATLDRYVDRLARSLATIVNVLDPDVVVLGGGMSNVDELYERVPRIWGRYVFGGEVATRLVRNRHGDSSGVRGAAMLVEQ